MQISRASALTWVGEDILSRLEAFDRSLDALATGMSESQLAAVLAQLDKINAIAGAFDVTQCEPLSRYMLALKDVLCLWRDTPSSLSPQSVTVASLATRSLCDYLSLIHGGAALSELTLFPDYQRICDVLSREYSPMDLWSQQEARRCLELWADSQKLEARLARLQTSGEHQARDVSSVEVSLLSVLRQRSVEAGKKLQMVCDERARQESSQAVIAALVSSIIQAVVQQDLELDVFLKRYLLASLSWLKAQTVPTDFAVQSVFWGFLAWQAKQSAPRASDTKAQLAIDYLAQTARWLKVRGSRYSHVYFNPEFRKTLIEAQQAVSAAVHVCGSFALTGALRANNSAAEDESGAVFKKMGFALNALHPSAVKFNQAFHAVISDSQIRPRREVQIEIASVLLVIGAMLSSMKSADESELEKYFFDLTQRLQALKEQRTLAAYEPWMLEFWGRQNWQAALSHIVEQLLNKLQEVESAFEKAWSQTKPADGFSLALDKLQQIKAIGQVLKFDDFAAAVSQLQEKIPAALAAPQDTHTPLQQALTSDLAHLSLMLSTWTYKPKILRFTPGLDDQDAFPVSESVFEIMTPSLMTAIEEPIHQEPSSQAFKQQDWDDEEPIESIFLAEADEMLAQAQQCIDKLRAEPQNSENLVTLRRSFHTLKGGARVVGLVPYGEAAWLVEARLNEQLARSSFAEPALLNVCERQVMKMQAWTHTLRNQVDMDLSVIDWCLDELKEALAELGRVPKFVPMPPISLPAVVWQQDEPSVEREEEIKTIGDLQISIQLYQAYLNETDEWSRQLALALSEWALDDSGPIQAQSLMWAHALAGSSATIGFQSCSQLAKLIEQVIERIQTESFYAPTVAQTLSDAAEELRRLLHQFAAGFLKTVDAQLLERLQAYLEPLLTTAFKPDAATPPATPLALAAATEQVGPRSNSAVVDADMRVVFAEECAQLTASLDAALRAWMQAPAEREHRSQALGALHTLKGSARLVGEQVLAHSAHVLESNIEDLSAQPSTQQIQSLLQQADDLVGQFAKTSSTIQSPDARLAVITPAETQETMRVHTSTIDRLTNQTGELMIARSRLAAEIARSQHTIADMTVQVQRLRDQLRELELQTESQLQSRSPQTSDQEHHHFDPLELDRFTRTQELVRFMAEAVGDISTLQRNLQRGLNNAEDELAVQHRHTRDIQRNLLRTRMVAFDSIGERLRRVVRVSSQSLGKSTDLLIQNGEQEMDRSVLERMIPVFEHLLRNAVVHGIEMPARRLTQGKAEQGRIVIALAQQGNDVTVTLQDDGQGIDREALLAKARQQFGRLDFPADPTELIFMQGLSLAESVSELAGRGIGMDVVRSQVLVLGGRVEVSSTKNQSTTFKLILPLTTAVTQIALVRLGSHLLGVPSHLISSIERIKPEQMQQTKRLRSFTHEERSVPFYDFRSLLHYKKSSTQAQKNGTTTERVILVQSAGQMVALHVDEVIGNQEVIVKNLGVQLAKMPGLSGMTVLPSGQIVLIYNPVALAAVYGTRALPSDESSAVSGDDANGINQPKAPLVLVVDDSITMRRVLQRFLLREACRVSLAADGHHALDALRLETPALVLSDVEMPRMDGFELLSNIRASQQWHDLPVVMITSRIADKHRDRAVELGANEYLGKPYSEDELLKVLRRYVDHPVVRVI